MENLPAFPKPSGNPTPNDHTMARSMPETPLPSLSPADESLVAALMKNGMITTELLQAAQRYGAENHRDLRQSILELNLISPETLNALAFEHLADDGRWQRRHGRRPARRHVRAALARPRQASARHPQRAQGARRHRDAARPGRPDPRARRSSRGPPTSTSTPRRTASASATGSTASSRTSSSSTPALTTPLISRIKVISNLNIVERRHSQDGRITIQHQNRRRDLRVATIPDGAGREDRHPDPRGC